MLLSRRIQDTPIMFAFGVVAAESFDGKCAEAAARGGKH